MCSDKVITKAEKQKKNSEKQQNLQQSSQQEQQLNETTKTTELTETNKSSSQSNNSKNNPRHIYEIELCGFKSRFINIGDEQKPPLVFIPGALQDIETSNVFHDGLSPHFNYFFLELPGTGCTTALSADKPFVFIADCLREFAQAYVQKPFTLCSCSYSTIVALEFAKKYPAYLKDMVLMTTTTQLPKHAENQTVQMMADCLHAPEAFAEGFIDMLSSDKARIPREETIRKTLIRRAMRFTDNQRMAFIYNTVRLMAHKVEELGRVECPVMCIGAEFDPYITPEACERLSRMLPRGQISFIANADHLAHIRRPKETIETLLSFLLRDVTISS